jgi:hypothetical protein
LGKTLGVRGDDGNDDDHISFYRMMWDGERKGNGDTHGMVDWLV